MGETTPEQSVSLWLRDLSEGDDDAVRQLWDRYFVRLVEIARNRLRNVPRRVFDEEDVAVDAFDSVCRAIKDGRYPRLDNRDELWRLLFVVTMNKATSRIRQQAALRRGGGRVRGDSVFVGAGDEVAKYAIDGEPTPEVALIMIEQAHELLDKLGDQVLREVAQLKMQGYTDEEIAQQLGCVRRTVVRRLRIIRELWSEAIQ